MFCMNTFLYCNVKNSFKSMGEKLWKIFFRSFFSVDLFLKPFLKCLFVKFGKKQNWIMISSVRKSLFLGSGCLTERLEWSLSSVITDELCRQFSQVNTFSFNEECPCTISIFLRKNFWINTGIWTGRYFVGFP